MLNSESGLRQKTGIEVLEVCEEDYSKVKIAKEETRQRSS